MLAHRLAAAARGAARRGRHAWSRWRRCMPSRTATANTCSTTAGRMRWSAPAATTIPKLQVAAPFSPVPGPRLLRRPGIRHPGRRAGERVRTGVPVAGPVVGARDVLHAGRMDRAGRGRLAAARRHAVPLGERRLRQFRRFPRRAVVTQAQGAAARAARRQRRGADVPGAVRRGSERSALGCVLSLLPLDGGPQMGLAPI